MTQVPNVMAYADRSSVRAGETLVFHVSVEGATEYDAQLVRLVCGDTGPKGPGLKEVPIAHPVNGRQRGRAQVTNAGSWVAVDGITALDVRGGWSAEVLVWPTRPGAGRQALLSHADPDGAGWTLALDEAGRPELAVGGDRIRLDRALAPRRWYRLGASRDGASGRIFLSADALPGQGAVNDPAQSVEGHAPGPVAFPTVPLTIAAVLRGRDQGRWLTGHHFDGRLEAPRLTAFAADGRAVVVGWNFAADIFSTRVRSSAGPALDGRTQNGPKRAVKGAAWDGSVQDWRMRPEHYAAIHFHSDDLTDAGWRPSLRVALPSDLPSGVYALRLTGVGPAHHVSFFVTPPPGTARAAVAFLASTVTYQAYATYRRRMTPGPFELTMGALPTVDLQDIQLIQHPELGSSTYDIHPDGSGVHFVSERRPQFNLRPTGRYWNFCMDLCLIDWLEAHGIAYDVITDHDLHAHGAALLAPYQCVLTGSHPEYHSLEMIEGLEAFTLGGGRLMYMGGNGFYWRVSFDPEQPWVLEVRRAEDGTRAWAEDPGEYYHQTTGEYGGLWRRVGRPPNRLVGIGFIAQGFDNSSYYRRKPAADDPRAAFIFEGVPESILGDFGSWGDGAAGLELDAADPGLGTPAHALVLASSENHSNAFLLVNEEVASARRSLDGAFSARIRADMTFFETPGGGAVFSTGSICYVASLFKAGDGYANPISRLTLNVLRRFADPAPFDCPVA